MDAGTDGVIGPNRAFFMISLLSSPLAINIAFLDCIIGFTPKVMALFGTSFLFSKNLELASIVVSPKSTQWVSLTNSLDGSLKPIWPL